MVLSALYLAQELKRGWIPSDAGMLAESAERVLHGALPHRDYRELYTGLLSYLNAAAFRALGTNLVSMRYMLFIFFLAWVPAFHYAASRFVSAPLAAATTLLAVAWGPPNYAAAMPSWYNLFFATFGLAALLHYIILAKPDSPEVYFLSGFHDPTGIFFDSYEDASGRTQRALEAIQRHNINLVVLNHHRSFASPISDDLKTALEREFPNRADAGDFEVRWKP